MADWHPVKYVFHSLVDVQWFCSLVTVAMLKLDKKKTYFPVKSHYEFRLWVLRIDGRWAATLFLLRMMKTTVFLLNNHCPGLVWVVYKKVMTVL